MKKADISSKELYKEIFPEDKKPDGENYVDFALIEEQLFSSEQEKQEALFLVKEKKVTGSYEGQEHYQNYTEKLVLFRGFFHGEKGEIPLVLYLSNQSVAGAQCACVECRRKNMSYYGADFCRHIQALYFIAKAKLKTEIVYDVTDRFAQHLISSFRSSSARKLTSQAVKPEGGLTLEARVKKVEDSLRVSFRVGESKLFVIRDLRAFDQQVKNRELVLFGKNTYLSLAREHFSKDSLRILSFLEKCIDSLESMEKILRRKYPYNYNYIIGNFGFKNEIRLEGEWLDEFYDLLKEIPVPYERGGKKKKEEVLSAAVRNPRIQVETRPIHDVNEKGFEGLEVYMELPKLMKGGKKAYHLSGNKLCQTEEDFLKKYEMLEEIFHSGRGAIDIGKGNLSEFYHTILPEISEYVRLKEYEQEEVEAWIPEEPQFLFYLDASGQNIICRAEVSYGEKKFSLMDSMKKDAGEKVDYDFCRVYTREKEVLDTVSSYLPFTDCSGEESFHCDSQEELAFRFLSEGVETLMGLGEVHATDAFQNIDIRKKVKVSVGVSVSGGLLDLSISAENLSREDLLEILKSYRLKKRYHRLKNGSFVSTQDESLGMLDEILETAQIKDKEFLKENLKLPMYRSMYLNKLLEENDSVYEERDQKFKELVKEFKTISESEFTVPRSLQKVLRNYQKTGYKWFRMLDAYGFGGILADDMGLGKTLQTIALLLSIQEKEGKQTSLIVCPASLVYNWGEEIKRFAPGLSTALVSGNREQRKELFGKMEDYDVLVTSYQLLHMDLESYEGRSFRFEIIDEAQYIKNHTTAMAKAVKVIKAQTKLALTGTPIENQLSELWSIFDYLMPGFLYRYEAFKKNFETKIAKNQDKEASERLKKMVQPFILRRLKENVLKDIPEKLEKVYHVKMEKKQQELYDAQVQHLKESIGAQSEENFNRSKMKILAELTRLRQICCDPSLCFEAYKEGSAKREACLEVVKNAIDSGHRILLFSQFTSMLKLLEEDFKKAGIDCFKITGQTPKQERLRLVNEFNEGDTPVFLISLKAGGTGLNLVGADVVIHYDPWWNLAVQNQATDRAHRIGQKKTVTVFKMLIKGTIEEKIAALQEAKKNLADEILSGEGSSLARMTKEEFLEILS